MDTLWLRLTAGLCAKKGVETPMHCWLKATTTQVSQYILLYGFCWRQSDRSCLFCQKYIQFELEVVLSKAKSRQPLIC